MIEMSYYRRVAIETYWNPGEPSSKRVRARPLPGQGFPLDMHVECSTRMRESHPVGTVFVLDAQVKQKKGGAPFLYASWQWPYAVVAEDVAYERIASGTL